MIRSASWLLLAALACITTVARAQSVTGRVFDQNHRPLSSALVELRLVSGVSVQTTLTSGSGGFILQAPAPGVYRYRVAAIGYRQVPLTSITVSAAGLVLADIQMQPVSVRLPDLLSIAGSKFCGRRNANADLFDGLLQAAHTALEVMETSVNTHQVAFTVARIDSRTIYGGMLNLTTSDTTIQPLARWPIQSINPDTLRVVGFGRTLERGNENTREYYGPDARVLFSDWFLASHCFTIDKPDKKHPSDSLHLRFAPAHKSKLVDVSGELVLDAHTLALLQMSFTHQNLPGWMSEGVAGGNMEFSPMASGLWVTRSWALWAPIGGGGSDGRLSMRGEVERYGWVIEMVKGDSAAGSDPRTK